MITYSYYRYDIVTIGLKIYLLLWTFYSNNRSIIQQNSGKTFTLSTVFDKISSMNAQIHENQRKIVSGLHCFISKIIHQKVVSAVNDRNQDAEVQYAIFEA
jgi:hypothetical protein